MWEGGGGGASWCPPFWKEDTQQQQPRAGSENTFKRQRRKVGDSGDPQKTPDFAVRIIILWQLPTPSKPEPQPEFWSEVKSHSHLQGSRKERNENLTWEGGASSSPRGAPLTSSAATQDTWGQTLSRGGGGTGWGGAQGGGKHLGEEQFASYFSFCFLGTSGSRSWLSSFSPPSPRFPGLSHCPLLVGSPQYFSPTL